MKISILRISWTLLGPVSALLLAAVGSARADVAAGKAKFNSICAECHDSADFEGEDVNGLADTLGRISRGEIKHKKSVALSGKEIADLAAYMASGGK